MHKHATACQNQYAQCKRYTGEKVKSFRNHADHGGYGGCDRVVHSGVQQKELLQKHADSQRCQQDSDATDQLVQRIHHLGTVSCGLFGFAYQLSGIGFFSDTGKTRQTGARHKKAPGHQVVAQLLLHRSSFSGQKRLVDFRSALADLCVRGHLVAGPQKNNVIPHQLFRGQVHALPVPHGGGGGNMQKRDLFQFMLDAQFLYDSDERVEKDNT